MRVTENTLVRVLTLVLLAGLASAALAQSLPKLPKDFTFTGAPGSPGAVTFSHENHLAAQARPDCVTCHPKSFKMLAPGATVDGQRIQHAQMEQRRQCGACHNGDQAVGLDDCAHCHRM